MRSQPRFLTGAALAALGALVASAAQAAPANFGPDRPATASESVVTPHVAGGVPTILYCPADSDAPAYRSAIASLTGGICDYINSHLGTPPLAFLQTYDVVYTYPNNSYADPVAMGDVLADYVDGGGRVILGAFSTYSVGNAMEGRIMNPDYCPVTGPGANHFTSSNYAGNGTSYLHRNVGFYQDQLRDFLVMQGQGIRDGSWNDGEIAMAYRGDGRVMYLNAVGPALAGVGDFARIVANFTQWQMPGGVLYGCDDVGRLFTLNLRTGKGTQVGTLPMASVAEIEYRDDGVGFVQSGSAPQLQPFAIANGAATGPPVTQTGIFGGMESIGANSFACYSAFLCATSDIVFFNPSTGGVISGPTTTGVGPISGMAWNTPLLRMYYVTDQTGGCVPNSMIYWNGAFGDPLNSLGVAGFAAGSLEWGPDDNLYGGSVGGPGALYRINPTTGVSSLVGATGFGPMTGLALVSGPNTVDAGPFRPDVDATSLALAPPLPNPSRAGDAVVLRYTTARAGEVRVSIHDVVGRRVWMHEKAALDAGEHTIAWDGMDARGVRAPAGLYFVRLVTAEGERGAKLLRL